MYFMSSYAPEVLMNVWESVTFIGKLHIFDRNATPVS